MIDVASYPYLITIIIAWFSSHVIKYVIKYIKKDERGFIKHLFNSGDMPSSHTATVVSVVMLIGLIEGFDSGLFGLGSIFALIVMYDAVKVRRSSGEQGLALIELMIEQKSKIKKPVVAKGHYPLEVLVGAILGVLISFIVFLATK